MDATVKLVDLDGCGGMRGKVNSKTQVQEPNWGTLRVNSDREREKLTHPGHPPKKRWAKVRA